MRPALCGATNAVDSTVPLEGQEATEGNKMQKILRSPVTMKKKMSNNKTFGVPLKELARGPTGVRVPAFVRKICDFIQMHGIGHEGIFRINGSTRVVEKMKAIIDKTGDADLEEAGDVMAVASLLKMYLRELPDPIMTEALHHKFINVQLVHQSVHDECIKQLRILVRQLPEEHYMVLQYLIRFLVKVSQYETTNKMNSMALAIIFGPNLFRCSAGLDGLREQGITNIIVRLFIDEYESFFTSDDKEETLSPPAGPVGSKCIQVQAATSKRSPPVKPLPYQDYIRQKEAKKRKDTSSDVIRDVNSNSLIDKDREEYKRTDDIRDCDSPASSLLSPKDGSCVEDRSFSPFNLDSETGTSTAPSPVINDIASELVEKTIQETVSEHLFGQSPSPDREESLTSPSPEVPVPSPRRRRQKKQDLDSDIKDINHGMDFPDSQIRSMLEDAFPSVQDRKNSWSSSLVPDNKSPESSPKVKRKNPASSRGLDAFEPQGITTGLGPNDSASTRRRPSNSSNIPQIIEDPKRDRTNSRSPPSRRKAPEPPSRPSRVKSQLLKGQDHLLTEAALPGSGSPKSKSPRSYSPRSNSPRSMSPRSNSPRSNSSRSNSPTLKSSTSKTDSPKSRSPRSKSPRSQSPKPRSLRNRRSSLDDKTSHLPATDSQIRNVYADFDSLPSNSPILKSLTAGRIAPPKKRRSPSKRKGKRQESVQQPQSDEFSRPYTEPLSILIPGMELNDLDITQDTPNDTPQPKPRKKHSTNRSNDLGEDQSVSKQLEEMMNGVQNIPISPPRSPGRREHTVPPLNLTSLHEHTDGEDPIPAWKARHHFNESNQEAMLSPRSLKLQTTTHHLDQQEAPLSPRAGAKPFNFTRVSHDTDVPPSPPSAQSILTGMSKRTDKLPDENEMMNVKQLSKQIRTLKRKIKQYEEDFEDEHGYKPSHTHKTLQPQIKKMMGDLKKACKQLKEAKENAAKAKVPLSKTLPVQASSGRNLAKQFEEATLMTNLDIALRETEARLQEKREEAGRPEDIRDMGKEEIQEEKTAIQKALLQMENKFGRPSTKEAKELMKPLYDRYRNIKKLLVRLEIRQPEDGQQGLLDLQTIPENEETKEFQPKTMGQIHNIYHGSGEGEDEDMQTTDFTVTQDMKGVLGTIDMDDSFPSPADSRRSSSGGREESASTIEVASNLHAASLNELLARQNQSREDKKRLRKVLKEFEDNFLKDTGRCVQKEDRVPMETQYNEYKHLKKHLKLLEALVAKRQTQASSPTEEMTLAEF